jgi:hypothetical protein
MDRIVYTWENYVYLPIPKNVRTTYTNFFKENSWQEQEYYEVIKSNNNYYFAHIQDPETRYCKGVAQYIWLYKKQFLLEDDKIANVILNSFIDEHSMPISCLYPEIINKIDFIPLDNPNIPVNQLTNMFFKKNNIPFKIFPGKHLNKSSISQNELYKQIIDLRDKFEKQGFIDNTSYMAYDVKLYKNALRIK